MAGQYIVAVRRGRWQGSRFRSAHEGVRYPEHVQSASHRSDHGRVFSPDGPAGVRIREERAHEVCRRGSQTQQRSHHQRTRREKTVTVVEGDQVDRVTVCDRTRSFIHV